MLSNLIGTFLIAGAVILFIWFLRGLMLTPVKRGAHTKITVLVHVSGEETTLEQTVQGLHWLSANGTLPANVVILDGGMDPETAAIAQKLSVDTPGVCYQREDVSLWQRNECPKNYTDGSTPSSIAATRADMP